MAKLIIDRADVDKAIKQCIEDGNLDNSYDKTKINVTKVINKWKEKYGGLDEEELLKDLRDCVTDLANE